MPVPSSKVKLKVGEVIRERYRILGELGAGGYATVYRAAQLNLGDREVAIKVLAPKGRQRQNMQVAVHRFLREARAAASIEHNNVVAIYDVDFLEDGRPYIVMQRVDGHSLSNELDDYGPLEPARVLPRFCRTLAALAKAHDIGIIHRDIKPANILLTDPGSDEEELKLIDFGVAHLQEEDHKTLTQVHTRVGTARYLAPEYLRFGVVTPALDVYQMGLVLAEILTGEPANPGDGTAELLQRARRGELSLNPRLMESPLGAVLERALATEPADRYPSATEFRRALKKVDPATVPVFADTTSPRRRRSDSMSRQLSGPLVADTGVHQVGGNGDEGTATLAVRKFPPRAQDGGTAPTLANRVGAVSPAQLVPTKIAVIEPSATQPATPRLGEERSNRFLIVSVGVLGTAFLVLAVLVAVAGAKYVSEADPAVATASAEAPKEVAPVAAQKPARAVVIGLIAHPKEAEIFAGETRLGTGTARVVFPASDQKPRRLVVRAPGHAETGVLVDPRGPSRLQVRLEPAPSAPAQAPGVVAPDGEVPPAVVPQAAAEEKPAGAEPDPSQEPTEVKVAPRKKSPRGTRPRKTPKAAPDKNKGRPKGFRILE